MSFRIERLVGGDDLVVLRLSGRVDAENVDTLRTVVGREPGRLAIDLKELTLADREAVRLLALCETKGIELRNCPAYVREWVAREGTRTGTKTLRPGDRSRK
jgi:hypothetical protein